MNNYQEKIARILRTDKRLIADLEFQLERVTGKVGVIQKLSEENDRIVKEKLAELGLTPKAQAQEVYDALISKLEADDIKLAEAMGVTSLRGAEMAQKIVDFLIKIHPCRKGYFLKKEKAKQLLVAEPPKNVLKALGYKYVEELLEKEDLLEVYSAIRFLEDQEWQNKIFFKQYETLHKDDFEERLIEARVLNQKWAKAAEKFVAKKYHNVSHLKELGVIFVIPTFLGISGEILRLTMLLIHYLYEVEYYADVFQYFNQNGHSFAEQMISVLRGDVIENRLPKQPPEFGRPRFLVLQRYLAKQDEFDWRLFEPHINPEALHWQKAETELLKINRMIPALQNGLEFWGGLGWVGDYFQTETGVDVLVSFNLIDTAMALVKQKELVKYLYHHQEALWNKIFSEYFGLSELEERSKKHLIQGWFEI
ncbi:MAG: hypothetical protein AAB454_01685 [Patescibacteria group bacterium]